MKSGAIVISSAVLTLATGCIVEPATWARASNPGVKVTNEIKIIVQAAKNGRAPGIPYVSGKTDISAIQEAWGKPDSQNFAGAGIYDTFSHHFAAFGFNKGGQLFDVRSYAQNLHSITVRSVENVLGSPGAVHHYAGEPIFLYPAGADFQLLWVFSKPTKSHPTSYLDHISVFNPQASVDNMAATGPAPTPTIDLRPGVVGHSFTFSIPKPQPGYAVTEFEWLSHNGRPVVNMFDEAVRNAATGKVPGFEVSHYGQTFSFVYTSSMVDEAGYVRVIEQNSSGRAIIGQSGNILLK